MQELTFEKLPDLEISLSRKATNNILCGSFYHPGCSKYKKKFKSNSTYPNATFCRTCSLLEVLTRANDADGPRNTGAMPNEPLSCLTLEQYMIPLNFRTFTTSNGLLKLLPYCENYK